MNAMSPTPEVDTGRLETLIGEARDFSRIAKIVAENLLLNAAHQDGVLIRPLSAEDEQALFFSILLAAAAGRKLYNLFHQIEEDAS